MPEACDATIRTVESTSVDPKVKAFYDRAYRIYGKLYQDLRESFGQISELVGAPFLTPVTSASLPPLRVFQNGSDPILLVECEPAGLTRHQFPDLGVEHLDLG